MIHSITFSPNQYLNRKFDCRHQLKLEDVERLDNSFRTNETDSQFDGERYADYYRILNSINKSQQNDDDYDENHEKNRRIVNEIPFDYDKLKERNEEVETDYKYPETFHCLLKEHNLKCECLPIICRKELEILMKTADTVVKEEKDSWRKTSHGTLTQFELLLKLRQKENKYFRFLSSSYIELHCFYRLIKIILQIISFEELKSKLFGEKPISSTIEDQNKIDITSTSYGKLLNNLQETIRLPNTKHLIPPTPDTQPFIDSIAQLISNKGKSHEEKLLFSEDNRDMKYEFLRFNHPFHNYYQEKLKKYSATTKISSPIINRTDNEECFKSITDIVLAAADEHEKEKSNERKRLAYERAHNITKRILSEYMAPKGNNIIPNGHFHKDWQRFVKTWFNQPARKKRRHDKRVEKVKRMNPCPVNKMKPAVHCPSQRYNSRQRLGRGFTMDELKAVGLHWRYAQTIGISVDLRRRNKSMESFEKNKERLTEYMNRVTVLPKKKKQDAMDVDMENTVSKVIVPITKDNQVFQGTKKITKKESERGAYAFNLIKKARNDKKMKGKLEKEEKDKQEKLK
ncbi:hypothetical protein SNEBB_009465 [Seison nebaliae]|nr:hypothetical protein SNEBB_009465 [Seison nebaliae]